LESQNSTIPTEQPSPIPARHCKNCGAPFVSTHGRKVYCSKACRKAFERRPLTQWGVCLEPGCGRRIHPDNKRGYCNPHRFPRHRPSVESKFCQKCGERLYTNNESLYCGRHRHLSEGFRNSQARHEARDHEALRLVDILRAQVDAAKFQLSALETRLAEAEKTKAKAEKVLATRGGRDPEDKSKIATGG
jgi:uncharacterized Zn finger protein (UPF0148 family)